MTGALNTDEKETRAANAALEKKVLGCSPSVGVAADTKMFSEISEALLTGLDGDMSCTFPDCIKDIRGKDANYEFATSSTLPPLRLEYSHNIATETLGLVFIHTHLHGKELKHEYLHTYYRGYGDTDDLS